ncbi:hypothetical protein [Nonomuraea sp. NPDC049158]|uniref:hypothetical protein n=1 Tax=Nonomuraea sp. NPDC049158 TaxID=3155649 RepID=UPI0033FAA10E
MRIKRTRSVTTGIAAVATALGRDRRLTQVTAAPSPAGPWSEWRDEWTIDPVTGAVA